MGASNGAKLDGNYGYGRRFCTFLNNFEKERKLEMLAKSFLIVFPALNREKWPSENMLFAHGSVLINELKVNKN